jgi:AraC family transcriptional regulator
MNELTTIAGTRQRVRLPERVGSLYNGWLKVEHSTIDRMDDYRVENLVMFSGGWVAVQQCSWSRPIENLWTVSKDSYLLDLSLDNRKYGATAEYLGGGDKVAPRTLGSMYMVPPGQTMLLRSKQGQARSLRCFLDAELIDAYLPEKPDWNDRQSAVLDMVRFGGGRIEWLLRRMYRELQEADFATESMVESIARQLAVEIIRRFNLRDQEPSYHLGGLAPWRMRLIRDRVYSDLPMPDLEELAKLCDMTVRHLSRAFRTETGQTAGKYLEAAMAERASIMLGNGVPVREVAASLGYATSGGFSCAFRRATGLLPREVKAIRGTATLN